MSEVVSAGEVEERAQFMLRMRARGVGDLRLLRALERAPRVAVHAGALCRHRGARHRAAHRLRPDRPAASIVAAMIEALEVRPDSRVLEMAPAPATPRRCWRKWRATSSPWSAARRSRSRPPSGWPRSG